MASASSRRSPSGNWRILNSPRLSARRPSHYMTCRHMQSASAARRAIAGSADRSANQPCKAAPCRNRVAQALFAEHTENPPGGIVQSRQIVVVPDDIGGSFRSLARHRAPEQGRDRRDPRAAAVGYRADRTRPQRHRDPVVPPGLHQVSQGGARRRAAPEDGLHLGHRRRGRRGERRDGARHRGRERAGAVEPRGRRALSRAAVRRRPRGAGAGPRHPARRMEGDAGHRARRQDARHRRRQRHLVGARPARAARSACG